MASSLLLPLYLHLLMLGHKRMPCPLCRHLPLEASQQSQEELKWFLMLMYVMLLPILSLSLSLRLRTSLELWWALLMQRLGMSPTHSISYCPASALLPLSSTQDQMGNVQTPLRVCARLLLGSSLCCPAWYIRSIRVS